MNTFTDTQGRTWTIELDFAKLRRIKKSGVDLGNVELIGRTWAEVLSDDQKALSVIWLSLDTETSEDEWLAAMNGATLEAARDALLAALMSFTPPSKQDMVKAAAAKVHQKYREAIAAATHQIETLTDETTQQALEALGMSPSSAQAFSDSSTTAGR
jgi:hypothetical protein